MAQRLARPDAVATPAEVADTAEKVRRYFGVALPLHARDEEESLIPRLRGKDPAVDRELDTMQAEHADHGPILDRLVALCDALVADPSRRVELGPALGELADTLATHFVDHLGREEAVIFPALARLPAEERAQMVAELRARRA
jgi:iron-sulfur cluster repair protein YtfE (RIC family)